MKFPDFPLRFGTLLASTMLAAATVTAQQSGQLTGTVVSAGGEAAALTLVSIPELRREITTDDGGRFTFEEVPPGTYVVTAVSPRFGGASARVEVKAGGVEVIRLVLDQRVHAEGITVTATGVATGLDEVVQPVDVMDGEELALRRDSTLGETLAKQPGVNSTSYGAGSSRPVIRGLGSDRIRILENGLDTGDVSSIGPDHAVAMDPLAAERIEIIRGPATLLWGANAMGGVVNTIDNRVPDRPASQPVTGAVDLSYGSNSEKKAGSAKLDGGSGSVAWHLDLLARDQGDYSSPAPRLEEGHHEDGDDGNHEEEHETGTVENSWSKARGATLGGSYVTERGFIGLALSGYDTEYGIPAHSHHHDEGGTGGNGESAGVHSELEQQRVDLHSRLDNPFAGFSALNFSAGLRDYNHQEIEGDEVGTRFENRWAEARLDGVHRPLGAFTGTLGMQYVHREFGAFGDEAFVEPTDTTRFGVYLFEQSPADPVGAQMGFRYERQDTRSSDPELPDRDFQTVSLSAGLVVEVSENWGFSISINRPQRAPTPEELYANGPHAATFSWEVGDPQLEPEVGRGVEGGIRAEYKRFEATLSGFATLYDDFIYLAETGDQIDGFDVFQFTQVNTEFYGFELHGHLELIHGANSHVHLGFSYDQVRAAVRQSGEPLARIPPRRARLALVYLTQRWDARIEGWWVDEQTRVAEHESPTPGYQMLNASVGYKIFAGRMMHEFLLNGTNLSDEVAYNAVSFIKFQAPVPGRNVSVVYRFLF